HHAAQHIRAEVGGSMQAMQWLDDILGDLESLAHPAFIAVLLVLGPGRSLALGLSTKCCSQTSVATLEVKALMSGVELYRSVNAAPPARLEDLVPRYAKELHADPWGHPYVFYSGAGGVAIVSAGPDGELGTGDDIVLLSRK